MNKLQLAGAIEAARQKTLAIVSSEPAESRWRVFKGIILHCQKEAQASRPGVRALQDSMATLLSVGGVGSEMAGYANPAAIVELLWYLDRMSFCAAGLACWGLNASDPKQMQATTWACSAAAFAMAADSVFESLGWLPPSKRPAAKQSAPINNMADPLDYCNN